MFAIILWRWYNIKVAFYDFIKKGEIFLNKKDISQIRRRLAVDKHSIHNIYGCYVNVRKEIISHLNCSMSLASESEVEKYLGFLKKTLSGSLGKNLINIDFATHQVADSDEHRLLMALRNSKLEDEAVREEFFNKVIPTISMEDENYLILLASESFDLPSRSGEGESQDMFTYFICAVCPVKDGKSALGYTKDDGFHGFTTKQTVCPPEVGFIFPAFTDGGANIYSSLLYSKSPELLYDEFVDSIFNTPLPMSSVEAKENFQFILADTLDEECSVNLMQSIHGHISEKIMEHTATKNPEPLDISIDEIGDILSYGGVSNEKIDAFTSKCEEIFPTGMVNPENIMDCKKFEITCPQMKISVKPEHSGTLETKVINGRKYLLVPFDDETQINGVPVNLSNKVEENIEKPITTTDNIIDVEVVMVEDDAEAMTTV